MSSNKELRRAKHDAYVNKQEKKGKDVVKWIFIGLIALAVIYMLAMVLAQ